MAVRTWANTLGVTVGTGLLAGAGQLGIGYGLGVVRWDRDFPTRGPWHAQLTWVAFFAIVAVVAGGYAGAWQARRARQAATIGLRIAVALTAAVGALVVLPLVVRPAAASHPPEGGDPRIAATLTVVAGLLVGVVAAFAATSVPAVSGSIVATVLWLWIIALISAASTLGGGASWASARLGLLPAEGVWVPVTLLVPAVLIALGVAAIARFGGSDARAVGASGVAGPAVVGLAYLIAGPGGGSDGTAYRTALLAIAAGVVVSAAVAMARRRPARPAPAAAPAGPTDETTAAGPSDETTAEPTTEERPTAEPEPEPATSKASEPETPETATTATSTAAAPKTPATATSTAAAKPPATATSTAVAPQTPATAKSTAAAKPPPAAKAAKSKPPKAAAQPSTPEPAPGRAEPAPDRAEPAPPPLAKPSQTKRPAREETPAPPPASAAPPKEEPAPAKTRRLPRFGRRRTEAADRAAPAASDEHIDWVKALRAEESPARAGGKSAPARHAKPAEPKPESDDETPG